MLVPDLQRGLYREDGLFLIKQTTLRQLEIFKKKLYTLFKREALKITIEEEKAEVNFLDTKVYLFNSTHRPYYKENENLKNINYFRNHPKTI